MLEWERHAYTFRTFSTEGFTYRTLPRLLDRAYSSLVGKMILAFSIIPGDVSELIQFPLTVTLPYDVLGTWPSAHWL